MLWSYAEPFNQSYFKLHNNNKLVKVCHLLLYRLVCTCVSYIIYVILVKVQQSEVQEIDLVAAAEDILLKICETVLNQDRLVQYSCALLDIRS